MLAHPIDGQRLRFSRSGHLNTVEEIIYHEFQFKKDNVMRAHNHFRLFEYAAHFTLGHGCQYFRYNFLNVSRGQIDPVENNRFLQHHIVERIDFRFGPRQQTVHG